MSDRAKSQPPMHGRTQSGARKPPDQAPQPARQYPEPTTSFRCQVEGCSVPPHRLYYQNGRPIWYCGAHEKAGRWERLPEYPEPPAWEDIPAAWLDKVLKGANNLKAREEQSIPMRQRQIAEAEANIRKWRALLEHAETSLEKYTRTAVEAAAELTRRVAQTRKEPPE